MLNSSFSKKLLLFTLLTSFSPLTACGQKEPSAPSTNTSQSSTVQTTSSQQDQDKSQTSSATSEANQSVEVASEQEEQEITETVTNSSGSEIVTALDVDGLSAGDYSSIAGTWANAKGQVFTVTAEGILYFGESSDETIYSKIERAGLNSFGRIGGSVGFYKGDERQGGAHISIVPAGVANILGEVTDLDHIEIGHDISSGYPEQQFFRQD